MSNFCPYFECSNYLDLEHFAYICENEADRVIPIVRQRGAKNWYIAYDLIPPFGTEKWSGSWTTGPTQGRSS